MEESEVHYCETSVEALLSNDKELRNLSAEVGKTLE